MSSGTSTSHLHLDPPPPGLRIGVDTHADVHVAVAIDELGRRHATISLPTTMAGLRRLHAWAHQLGPVVAWGIEGTGSYGARLARLLVDHGEAVLEVSRPDRRLRRDLGKSDPIDAEAAARAVLAGTALGQPKAGTGPAESLRHLRAARQAALKARTQAANQLRALLLHAPEELRALRDQANPGRLAASCARLRPATATTGADLLKHTLRSIAGRWLALDTEIRTLDTLIDPLLRSAVPVLLGRRGIGPDVAATLLVTAGDNPQRLRSERAFAALCGASPIPASSGKTHRHRLNRGGDRQANRALHVIVLNRMQHDPRTRAYVARRTAEGRSKLEIMRCLIGRVSRGDLHGAGRAPRQVSGDGLVAEPPDGQFEFRHPRRPETRRPASGICPQQGPNNETPAARASTADEQLQARSRRCSWDGTGPAPHTT